jgi:plasmid stability protein
MARQLTVRGVPDEVAHRLEALSRARGQSVNATVNEILAEAVGQQARLRRLQRYMTWTPADLAEFSKALAEIRVVDEEMWR